MVHLVLLLAAAALVSENCGTEANVINVDNSLNNIDNSLEPNVVIPAKKPRRLKKFVRIWTPPESQVKRDIDEKTVLKCVVMGNPPPFVTWTKNGEAIHDFEEEINEIPPADGIVQLVSKLIITTPTPGEDVYTCIATAGLNTQTASSTVYTLQGDNDEQDLLALEKALMPTKPIITYYYEEVFQDIGNVLILPCRVHSSTKSQVYWYDNNERFISNRNPRMKVLPSGDLMIKDLRWSEMGNFTCYAKNLYGKDSVNTFVYPTKKSN